MVASGTGVGARRISPVAVADRAVVEPEHSDDGIPASPGRDVDEALAAAVDLRVHRLAMPARGQRTPVLVQHDAERAVELLDCPAQRDRPSRGVDAGDLEVVPVGERAHPGNVVLSGSVAFRELPFGQAAALRRRRAQVVRRFGSRRASAGAAGRR